MSKLHEQNLKSLKALKYPEERLNLKKKVNKNAFDLSEIHMKLTNIPI